MLQAGAYQQAAASTPHPLLYKALLANSLSAGGCQPLRSATLPLTLAHFHAKIRHTENKCLCRRARPHNFMQF